MSVTLQLLTELNLVLKEALTQVSGDIILRNFVVKTYRSIIDDTEIVKNDSFQDDFIHYQLLTFCQTTRLQCINSHILLSNRFVLHPQYHGRLSR